MPQLYIADHFAEYRLRVDLEREKEIEYLINNNQSTEMVVNHSELIIDKLLENEKCCLKNADYAMYYLSPEFEQCKTMMKQYRDGINRQEIGNQLTRSIDDLIEQCDNKLIIRIDYHPFENLRNQRVEWARSPMTYFTKSRRLY